MHKIGLPGDHKFMVDGTVTGYTRKLYVWPEALPPVMP